MPQNYQTSINVFTIIKLPNIIWMGSHQNMHMG